MKHTEKYYINRIKKNLHLENNWKDFYLFTSRSTPRERGVRIEHIDEETHKKTLIRESTSREKLYNETEYYKAIYTSKGRIEWWKKF